MRIEYEPLDVLYQQLWDGNPKDHDFDQLRASMDRYGYVAPPMRDEGTGKLCAGHGRIIELWQRKEQGLPPPERIHTREDGMWMVPIIRGVRFKSEAEFRAYVVTDNRLSEAGGWIDAKLATILREQQESEKGLAGMGYTDQQAQDLIADVERLSALSGPADGGSGPPSSEPTPPGEFRVYDEGQKKTVSCPKCGFHVVLDE